MTQIIIVGAGGHSKVVADSAVRAGFSIRGFVDDGPIVLLFRIIS